MPMKRWGSVPARIASIFPSRTAATILGGNRRALIGGFYAQVLLPAFGPDPGQESVSFRLRR